MGSHRWMACGDRREGEESTGACKGEQAMMLGPEKKRAARSES